MKIIKIFSFSTLIFFKLRHIFGVDNKIKISKSCIEYIINQPIKFSKRKSNFKCTSGNQNNKNGS